MLYADAIICPLSLPILNERMGKSASDATDVNHMSAVAFHAMHLYANNLSLHVQMLMLLLLTLLFMSYDMAVEDDDDAIPIMIKMMTFVMIKLKMKLMINRALVI
jgi:hypothetical protein